MAMAAHGTRLRQNDRRNGVKPSIGGGFHQYSRESSWVMSDEDMVNSQGSDVFSPTGSKAVVPFSSGSLSDFNAMLEEDAEEDYNMPIDDEQLGPEVENFAKRVDEFRIKSATEDPEPQELIDGFTADVWSHHQAIDKKAMDFHGEDEEREIEWADDMKYLEMEGKTWSLLGLLLKHRGSLEQHAEANNSANGTPLADYESNEVLRRRLFKNDSKFRELVIILEWLKETAPPPVIPKDTDGDHDVRSSGWMYTLHTLKQYKRMNQKPGEEIRLSKTGIYNYPDRLPSSHDPSANIVTELDPDSQSRLRRSIETDDQTYDIGFGRTLWQFLRKGDLDGAADWCRECGQHWRIPSILGGKEGYDLLVDDEIGRDFENSMMEDSSEPKGNRRRALWRRMCLALARKPRSGPGDMWEAACYGILAGDLKSVLPVCETWHDHLFAHVNAIVENRYEEYLQQHNRIPSTLRKFEIAESGVPMFNVENTLETVVDILSSKSNEFRFMDAQSCLALRTVQGAIISDRFSLLIKEMANQFRAFRENPTFSPVLDSHYPVDCTDWRLLRVVAHIIIVYKLSGSMYVEGPSADDAEEVIAGYIRMLAAAAKYSVIPLYAGRLTRAKAIDIMGEILLYIDDDQTRVEMIRLFRVHRLDVEATLRRTMENCLSQTEEMFKKDEVPQDITRQLANGPEFRRELEVEDQRMLKALEWMLLVDSMRDDLVRAGNVIYKRFYLTGRLNAARQLSLRIPSSIVIPGQQDDEDMSITAGITDHFAAANYVEYELLVIGIAALDEWRAVLSRNPNAGPRDPRRNKWKDDLEVAFEEAKSKLRSIVSGWLYEYRNQSDWGQIRLIRNMYIPDVTLALHGVYVGAGTYIRKDHFKSCFDLAVLVARPDSSVAETFVATGTMGKYVEQLASVSTTVLGVAKGLSVEGDGSGFSRGPGSEGTLAIWNIK